MKKKITYFAVALVVVVVAGLVYFLKDEKVYTIAESGTYTIEEKYEKVVIKAENVTLENMEATNIVVDASVGDGDVYFNNVKITKDLEIYGGGSNSVHIKNCEVNNIIAGRKETDTRIVIEEGSHVSSLKTVDHAIIEIFTTVDNLDIEGEARATVKVGASVGSIVVGEESINAVVIIEGESNDITVKNGAETPKIIISDNGIANGIIVEKEAVVEAIEISGTLTSIDVLENATVKNFNVAGAVEVLSFEKDSKVESAVISGHVDTLVVIDPVTISGSGTIEVVKTDNTDAVVAIATVVNDVKPIVKVPTVLGNTTIAINGNSITWVGVENASKYEVYVDGVLAGQTTGTFYDVSKYNTAGKTYVVTVKVIGDGINYASSTLSNEVRKTVASAPISLNAPVISLNGKEISWSAIANATGYEVYVNNIKVSTQKTATTYDMSSYNVGGTTYSVYVIATGVVNSSASNTVQMIVPKTVVGAPTVSLNNDLLSWNSVANASGYTITVKKGNLVVKTYTVNSSTTSQDLSGVEVGSNYKVSVVANGIGSYLDSVVSNEVSYSQNIFDFITLRYNYRYDNGSAYRTHWIQAIFELETKIDIKQPNGVDSRTSYETAFKNFISATNISDKEAAALLIGDNLIVTYYYLDDNGNEVVIPTKWDTPETRDLLIKENSWGDWLREPGDVKLADRTIPAHTNVGSSANIAYNAMQTSYISVALDEFVGKEMYIRFEAIVIKDGQAHVFTQTVSELVDFPEYTLAKPTVSLSGDTLSWNSVDQAFGYEIIAEQNGKVVKSVEVGKNDLSVNLGTLWLADGTYTIKVKALGNDDYNVNDSAISTGQEYVLNKILLKLEPENTAFTLSSGCLQLKMFGNFAEDLYIDPLTGVSSATTAVKESMIKLLNGVATDEEVIAAAKYIKNDIIFSMYYYNDDNEKVFVNTTTSYVYAKDKLWDGWYYTSALNPVSKGAVVVGPSTSSKISGLTLDSSRYLYSMVKFARKGTSGANNYDLGNVTGRTLYLQVNVINIVDGQVRLYQDVTSLDIKAGL